MAELRKKVLTSLRAMIVQRGRGRQQWLKIFLIIQVLLFNLEFIYQNQDHQTKQYQQRVCASIRFHGRLADSSLDRVSAQDA